MIDYSEYTLEREGVRSQDNYILTYSPKDSPMAVQERVAPWLANIVRTILLEKCPENVKEHPYGYRREPNANEYPKNKVDSGQFCPIIEE